MLVMYVAWLYHLLAIDKLYITGCGSMVDNATLYISREQVFYILLPCSVMQITVGLVPH